MKGVLHNVGGMDLSGSFSVGRTLPGIDLLNREMKDFQSFVGALSVKGAGPFGGFTEDLVNFVGATSDWVRDRARGGEVLATMPGAIGAVGKAYDAWVMQNLKPTQGVLDKAGKRVVEDPPGSGKFRDLTNWELIGMAMGGNPAVLSRAREMNYTLVGEQMYWRTKQQTLLDNRWEAVRSGDTERLRKADKAIVDFNASVPKGYESVKITGKTKADSLRSHRTTVRNREQMKTQKSMRSVGREVEAAW
jgi:hypothetical protein